MIGLLFIDHLWVWQERAKSNKCRQVDINDSRNRKYHWRYSFISLPRVRKPFTSHRVYSLDFLVTFRFYFRVTALSLIHAASNEY